MTDFEELYSEIIENEAELAKTDPEGSGKHLHNINNAAEVVISLYKNNIAANETEVKKEISENELKLKKEISDRELDLKNKQIKSDEEAKKADLVLRKDLHESEFEFKTRELEAKKDISDNEITAKKFIANAELDAKKDISEKELKLKERELEFKEKELEAKKDIARQESDNKKAELKLKKDISEKELEFKEKELEEERKKSNKDLWGKIAIALVPVVITTVGGIIAIKVSSKENRDTLMECMFSGEVLERAGELSSISSRELAKEALKLATEKVRK